MRGLGWPLSDAELPYAAPDSIEMLTQKALSELANISPKIHFKFPGLADATLDELG
jgi:hypothetical protein